MKRAIDLCGILFTLWLMFLLIATRPAWPVELYAPTMPVTPGTIATVPIWIVDAEAVAALQFTLEYNDQLLLFDGAETSVANFEISNVNESLPFEPQQASANLLVQLWGGGVNTIEGAQEIVRLQFLVIDCGMSPLLFDPVCAHTQIATTGLITVCTPELATYDGAVYAECTATVGVEADTWGRVKGLYR